MKAQTKTKKKYKKADEGSYWAFATINGLLGEFHYEIKNGKSRIWAHCYVKREDYKTKRERKMIEKDTAKYRFTYREGKYKRKEG